VFIQNWAITSNKELLGCRESTNQKKSTYIAKKESLVPMTIMQGVSLSLLSFHCQENPYALQRAPNKYGRGNWQADIPLRNRYMHRCIQRTGEVQGPTIDELYKL
jgi:hypothetical protein